MSSRVQVTAPLNSAPYWSVSVAVKVCVSPMDSKEAEVGEIEMATALGGSGMSTGGGSPPQAEKNSKDPIAAGVRGNPVSRLDGVGLKRREEVLALRALSNDEVSMNGKRGFQREVSMSGGASITPN